MTLVSNPRKAEIMYDEGSTYIAAVIAAGEPLDGTTGSSVWLPKDPAGGPLDGTG